MGPAISLTPTQRQAIERRRAFHESIAARAAAQRPQPERSTGIKGYVPVERALKQLEPEAPNVDMLLRALPREVMIWPVIPPEKKPPVSLRDEVQNNRISIRKIQKAVSEFYGVGLNYLLSQRRIKTIVLPRQVGMYLAKIITKKSLPEIGRRFGGRDHTTVLHACRKIEALMLKDADLAHEVALLIEIATGVQQ